MAEWVGARVELPARWHEFSLQQSTTQLAVWVDAGPGRVLALRPVLRNDPPDILTSVLMDAVEAGAGSLGLPKKMRVANAPEAKSLISHLGDRVDVVVGPVHEVARAMDVFAGIKSIKDPSGALATKDVSELLLRQFFVAAATFYRERPWGTLPNGRLFRFYMRRKNLFGAPLALLGNSDEEAPGFLMLSGPSNSVVKTGVNGTMVLENISPNDLLYLGVTFLRGADLARESRREAMRLGLEWGHTDGFPSLSCFHPLSLTTTPDKEDIERGIGILTSLTKLARKWKIEPGAQNEYRFLCEIGERRVQCRVILAY